MLATPKDIAFAKRVAALLRASARPVKGAGPYFDCLNAERIGAALLYERAAQAMEASGEWSMPTDAELTADRAKAWAVLMVEQPLGRK